MPEGQGKVGLDRGKMVTNLKCPQMFIHDQKYTTDKKYSAALIFNFCVSD